MAEALLAGPILARLRVVPRRIRILTVDSQEWWKKSWPPLSNRDSPVPQRGLMHPQQHP